MCKILVLLFICGLAPGSDTNISENAPRDRINTACPIDGAKVDPKIPCLKCKTADNKDVEIGFCCAQCREKGVKMDKDHPGCLLAEATGGAKP